MQCIVMVQAINFLAFLVSSLQFAFTTLLCINCQAASNQLFDVIELHFHFLRFTTPLCINCQGGLSSGHHCDCTALCFHNICCLNCVEEIDFSSGFSCYCTALCFHNISCFELVIIRSFLQFLHRTARCSHNIAFFLDSQSRPQKKELSFFSWASSPNWSFGGMVCPEFVIFALCSPVSQLVIWVIWRNLGTLWG